MRKTVVVAVLVCSVALAAAGGDKPKPKPKGEVVDSGTFGVFVAGKRVATEKFEIVKRADMSVATTELVMEATKPKASQESELQLAPNGDLVRYTWRELVDSKAQAVVEPAGELLVEHGTPSPQAKTEDTPLVMARSTPILDDYAFAHRELLAWRYLASGCTPNAEGKIACNLSKTEYLVLIPQQRTSSQVAIDFAGREKITLHGTERELTKLTLQGDGFEWAMWFDENNHLVRILVASENTEVLRD